MSDVEAAAEIAQGGMAGRAIEPTGSGHGLERRPQEGECLNCCTPLQGHYCHQCGQRGEVHRTLGGILHDIVHGVLHLDGKFWRTMPLLFVKPGELTRRYVSGQRARFISPIALYLFTVVAMFALVISVGDMNKGEVTIGPTKEPAATVEQQLDRIADYEQSLADLEEENFPGISGVRAGVEAEIAKAREQLREMQKAQGLPVDEPAEPSSNKGDGFNATVNLGPFTETARRMEQGLQQANDNPALFFTRVSMKAYKLSWLLIPISLPFMWLLFPFSRRFRMYDHAIFVTYSIAFMMLLLTLVSVAASLGAGGWVALAALVPPWHLYRQLKGAYGLSRGSALVRTAILSLFSLIALTLFIAIIFALGALG